MTILILQNKNIYQPNKLVLILKNCYKFVFGYMTELTPNCHNLYNLDSFTF